MATSRYLVVVYVATGGLQGPNLGSDEQETILVTWVVVDVTNCKVIAVHYNPVKPRNSDINDNNVTLKSARNLAGISEEQVKNAKPLETVIEEMDQFVKTKLNNGATFTLITDGQLHLRQVIHPEACKKSISLADYWYSFYDLRKEFCKFYQKSTRDVQSVQDMIKYLGLEPDGSAESAMQTVQNMAQVITRLIIDGKSPFKFHNLVGPRANPFPYIFFHHHHYHYYYQTYIIIIRLSKIYPAISKNINDRLCVSLNQSSI